MYSHINYKSAGPRYYCLDRTFSDTILMVGANATKINGLMFPRAIVKKIFRVKDMVISTIPGDGDTGKCGHALEGIFSLESGGGVEGSLVMNEDFCGTGIIK